MGQTTIATPLKASLPLGKNAPHDNRRAAEFSIEVVRSPDALHSHQVAWESLCAEALESNPWYEPWFLQAGLRHLHSKNPLWFLFIYRQPVRPKDPPLLCGMFPFEEYTPWRGLPIRELRLWRNEFVCLNTPPVRRGYAPQVISHVLDWASSHPHGAAFLDLPHLDARGPFSEALVDVLHERQIPTLAPYCYNRAFLTPAASAEEYLEASMTCHHRQELRRQRRRLAEQGTVTFRSFGSQDSLDEWLDAFFELEARGWKGEQGGALACQEGTRNFFTTLAHELASRHRLMLLRMDLDGRPIAFKFNLLADDGAFAFKINFDESFARFSPGVQLEVENIEQLHARSNIRWMDSCAVPGHFMISRLWSQRRMIHRVLVPCSRTGSLILGGFAAARFARQALRRAAKPDPKALFVPAPKSETSSPSAVRKNSMTAMRSLTATSSPVPDAVAGQPRHLILDESEFLTKFHRQPFLIGHDLCSHPLFALPRLLELARTLPEDHIEYNAGKLPVNQDQARTPRNGLSVEETIRRIEECESWMVLKSVESDPEYRDLLHACLAQVKPLSELICPGMMHGQAFIFLTSPNSVTPYHIDPEHNFLLQIRGSKKVSLFDGRDRTLLTDEDLERFYGGRVRNMSLPESHADKAWTFNLQAGSGLHFPVTYPHWVQNGPEVSISFSITFRTPDLEKRRMVYSLNRLLRARGLTPTSPGQSGWRDGLKYQAYRGLRKLGQVLGRDW